MVKVEQDTQITDAAMGQHSHELINDPRVKTATLKNSWKERPVGPKENINAHINSNLLSSRRTSKEPPIDALCISGDREHFKDEIGDVLTWAGDLTPNSSDTMWLAS
jgi:hypothetical protein